MVPLKLCHPLKGNQQTTTDCKSKRHKERGKGGEDTTDMDALLECFPLERLLAEESDFFSPPGPEFFLEDVREPALSLPTVMDTLPINVCHKTTLTVATGPTNFTNRQNIHKTEFEKNHKTGLLLCCY